MGLETVSSVVIRLEETLEVTIEFVHEPAREQITTRVDLPKVAISRSVIRFPALPPRRVPAAALVRPRATVRLKSQR